MNQYFLKCFKTSPSALSALVSGAEVNFTRINSSTLLRAGQQPCWGCSTSLGSAECLCKVEKWLIDELINEVTLLLSLQRSPLRSAAPRVVPGAAPGEEPGPAGPCQPLPQRWDPWLAAGLCQGSCQVRFCLCFGFFSHWKQQKNSIFATDSKNCAVFGF